jgi:hypothetical protein
VDMQCGASVSTPVCTLPETETCPEADCLCICLGGRLFPTTVFRDMQVSDEFDCF